MTTIELLEESLKQLKIIQRENLRREPNHPRNKFDYTVIVPDHPLGYHEPVSYTHLTLPTIRMV